MPRTHATKRADGRYMTTRDGRCFYGKTEKEALQKRAAYDMEKAQGLSHENMTVREYAERWLPIYRSQKNQKAYKMYEGYLNRFCDFVSDKPLRRVTKSDITAFYKLFDGYSSSLISKVRATVNGMFADAVDDGLILRNPCRDVKAPEGTKGSHRVLEPWEDAAVLQLADHRFGFAVILMRYAGLRRGEAIAINIDRDIIGGRIYVRGAVSYNNSVRGEMSGTKTAAGIRCVPVFQPVADAIIGRHGLAAPSAHGDLLTSIALRRAWESWKHNFEQLTGRPCTIRTHDFRHSFCTMICSAGVDIKTAMGWLGHVDEKMIRQIYDHMTEEREQKAAENVVKYLSTCQIACQAQKKTR